MALTKISRGLLSTGVSDSSDATAITIDSAEKVGIGTTSPNRNLTVFASNPVLNVKNSSADLHLEMSGENAYIGSSSSSGFIQIFTNNGNATSQFNADGSFQIGAGSIANLKFSQSSDVISITAKKDGTDDIDLAFLTQASGGSTSERMRITSAGKLGFNFTAPAALVDIKSGGSTSTPLRVLASSTTTSDYNDLWSVAEISGHGRMSIFDASQNEDILLNTNGTSTFAGALSKGSGSFKIDHPLESKKDTHHLYHSFIEGPQVDNLYRGTVTLNNGIATINLDAVSNMTEGTFVALNREVQCYTTNETDWDAVKGNVEGNILTISCQNTSSSATVSWLVIGERQDKNIYSSSITDENGKLIVEKLKSEEE